MSLNRRNFIKLGAVSGVAAAFSAGASSPILARASAKPYSELGVQLYTVRAAMEADYKRPLKAIADLGYKDLEFAGYFDHEPKEIRKFMDDIGLKSNSTHVRLPAFQQDFGVAIETAHTMGQTYLVLPWLHESDRSSLDDYKRHSALLNKRGEEAKKAGLQVAYHNHDFEFQAIDGVLPFDLLLAETDADLVKIELDLYWISKAGYNPVDYFKKAPGRYHICHVKDKASDGSITSVGSGTIDFNEIFKHAKAAGLKHFYVEDDSAPDPIASLANSFRTLS